MPAKPPPVRIVTRTDTPRPAPPLTVDTRGPGLTIRRRPRPVLLMNAYSESTQSQDQEKQ
jgi:hypothetical protein